MSWCPANAVASVGQTSLLGSMHLALNPPLGQPPSGRLQPGATIPLSQSSTYPSTEQTLSSLSVVVNGGGLGQIGDIIHNFNAALSGREGDVRDLLTRLDKFVGTLDRQRDNIVASIQALNRLAGTFAGQRDVITAGAAQDSARAGRADQGAAAHHDRAGQAARLQRHRHQAGQRHPGRPGHESEEPRADAPRARRRRTATSTRRSRRHPVFPFGQDFVDRGIRGDYINLLRSLDLTIPRLKRTAAGHPMGRSWSASWHRRPGTPATCNYTLDPLACRCGHRRAGGPPDCGARLRRRPPQLPLLPHRLPCTDAPAAARSPTPNRRRRRAHGTAADGPTGGGG